ncbi:hypothetical protein DFH06DRAFT_1144984 [Mycena polygramma]|nr:hypothetical protein DFH06DRAFT_1144984 [Mycena polygramma]
MSKFELFEFERATRMEPAGEKIKGDLSLQSRRPYMQQKALRTDITLDLPPIHSMALPCWRCGAPPAVVADSESLNAPLKAISVPDLTSLLTSNEVPLHTEIAHILAVVSDGEKKLQAVNSQIADLEATLAQLLRKREQIVEYVRQHRAILSPVRLAPPELVGHIFALTLAGDKRPPWYLGQICRSWRLAALPYPILWTSIAIRHASRTQLPLVETLLLRSRNAPLKIFWNGKTIDRPSADAVVSHCGRWRSLHVDTRFARIPDLEWLQPVCGYLTALETFSLDRAAPRTRFPEIFPIAPVLRQVFLSDWYFRVISPSVVIPWGQITTYHGAYDTSNQRKILAAATNLQQCAVRFVGTVQPHENSPITLSYLRRLCVDRSAALVHFTTPEIEELFSSMYTSKHDLLLVLPFLHRSSYSLKKLVLTALFLPNSSTSYNISLTFYASTLLEQTALFTAMTVHPTSHTLCPNLESLVHGFNGNFSHEEFFSVARSRFQLVPQSGAQLTSLRLFGPWDACPAHISAAIQELCGGGFDAAFLTKAEAAVLGPRELFPRSLLYLSLLSLHKLSTIDNTHKEGARMLTCSNCGYAFMATALVPDLPRAIEGVTWPDLTLLLTSNDVPLDSEIPPIHAIISDREKQLHAVDDQIFDLRSHLCESVRQHRAVLSPLRRVPPELLCEIFVLTLSGDGTAETPPWYLGQICRSWRFSALAYPSLWSSITIPNSRHSMLPLVQTQLRRSANALLTVHWSRNIRESGPIDPHSRDAVLAECSRWGALRLAVEGSIDDLEWLQPVAGHLTALRKFTLTTCAAPNIPDIFGQASSLREVAVESSGSKYWSSPAIVAPWAQVTHFRGVYPAEALLIILAEASNVLQCAVVGLEGDPELRTPIITACLQRLCINRTARLSQDSNSTQFLPSSSPNRSTPLAAQIHPVKPKVLQRS